MERSTPVRPQTSTDASPGWDWRGELRSLDAALTEVERQCTWDWRRDLAELEARLEQLAYKHGLATPPAQAT